LQLLLTQMPFTPRSATRTRKAPSRQIPRRVDSFRLDRISIRRREEALARLTYSAIAPTLFLIAFFVHPDQQIEVNDLEAAHRETFEFPDGWGTIGTRRLADAVPLP
jgi:hypothetical protein